MNKKYTLVLALLLGTFALSACENTWHGAGKDVENTGDAMQRQFN
ncbi:MAG: entericidin A/B family lipoprotein [Alphaproteobacteria bacterium]